MGTDGYAPEIYPFLRMVCQGRKPILDHHRRRPLCCTLFGARLYEWVLCFFSDNGGSPNNLQEAQVLALSQQDCEDFYSGTGYGITDDMICVGHDQDDYTGACYVRLPFSQKLSSDLNSCQRSVIRSRKQLLMQLRYLFCRATVAARSCAERARKTPGPSSA